MTGFWTKVYLVSWNCLMKILIMWPNIELPFEKKKDWKYYFHVSLPKWSVQRPLTLGVISKQYSAVTKPKSHISYDAFFRLFHISKIPYVPIFVSFWVDHNLRVLTKHCFFCLMFGIWYVDYQSLGIRRYQISILKHSACFLSISAPWVEPL